MIHRCNQNTYDDAALAREAPGLLVVVGIRRFVGVDEYEIKLFLRGEFLQGFNGRADAHFDLVCKACVFKVCARNL